MFNGLYYGHGIGIKTGGEIIESLNRKRRPFSQTSAYLMDIVVHPDYPKLYRTIIGGSGWNQPLPAQYGGSPWNLPGPIGFPPAQRTPGGVKPPQVRGIRTKIGRDAFV
jgi:hypothetical protein